MSNRTVAPAWSRSGSRPGEEGEEARLSTPKVRYGIACTTCSSRPDDVGTLATRRCQARLNYASAASSPGCTSSAKPLALPAACDLRGAAFAAGAAAAAFIVATLALSLMTAPSIAGAD